MQARVRRSDLPPVHCVEGIYGLQGGLPSAAGRRLLFVTVAEDFCR